MSGIEPKSPAWQAKIQATMLWLVRTMRKILYYYKTVAEHRTPVTDEIPTIVNKRNYKIYLFLKFVLNFEKCLWNICLVQVGPWRFCSWLNITELSVLCSQVPEFSDSCNWVPSSSGIWILIPWIVLPIPWRSV